MHKTLILSAIIALSSQAFAADISSVKTYLLQRLSVQASATATLTKQANAYYAAAKAVNFDYKKLSKDTATIKTLQAARAAWKKASPIYESVEGIVAGVDMLAEYDVILDAGSSAADGGDNVVPFDLTLPNGKVLKKPGNVFGITESTLWGTFKAFSSNVPADIDGKGLGFGDLLPDANVLKAGSEALERYTKELADKAATWTPTKESVFRALAANVPTAAPVFLDRWKNSRFVAGNTGTTRDFVAISSLEDLTSNIVSWQKLYAGLSTLVAAKNPVLDKSITKDLANFKTWSTALAAQEKRVKFKPEQAERIYKEGDKRATAITGSIVQAAALLGVAIEQ